MSSAPDSRTTQALVAEAARLRRLARALARDEARAEDLVQDALVAALERGPSGRLPGRGWLSAVLRNAARLGARSRARSAAREAEHARGRPAEHPASDDALARLEAQRRMVDALAALGEPERSAVVLRYLEDLPAREVARRQGVAVRTARARIGRGLAQLRARLERRSGDRGAWCAALGVGARRSARPAAAGIGGLAMGTAAKWCGAAAAAAILGGATILLRGGERAVPDAARAERGARVGEALRADVGRSDGGGARGPILAGTASSDAAAGAPGLPANAWAGPTFTGIVVDQAGRPVEGVTVALERRGASTARATSGSGGAFELPASPPGMGVLRARGAGFAEVAPGFLPWIPPPEPPRIVVARERVVGGRVVDSDGAPLAGAELALRLPATAAPSIRGANDGRDAAWTASDDRGRFRFEPLGLVPGTQIASVVPGLRAVVPPLPDADALDLIVTLEREDPSSWIEGVVLDAGGAPVAGALVAAGGDATTTGPGGGFALGGVDARAGEVRAVKAGSLPARAALEELGTEARASLVLRLGAAPETIRGRVVDASGAPVPGAWVWSPAATPFAQVRASGSPPRASSRTTVERVLCGAPPGDGLAVTADAHGAFAIPALDRGYALAALDVRTLAAAPARDARPGDDVVLRLEPARTARVAGTIRAESGAPFAGAEVHAYRWVGAAGELPVGEPAPRVEADGEGRFAYAELAIEGTFLLVGAADRDQCVSIALADVPDPEQVDVVLPGRRHLRLVLESDPDLATGFRVLDAAGRSVMATVALGGRRATAPAWSLRGGESGLIGVDATARTLVLERRGAGEVRRVPLDLPVEGVLELRL